ncbi:diacylglycerol kinase family lipid kinase [Proteiniclasticum sp. SCR006]|uniref:Diacylglycerol kinase family lipid kinase n=1 Tax=Proteiniclasticum aestuarii TaxID=2817862 RepID=A0A939H9A7_9CLOT|nr:diacylglycerol kinase family protein [Proteiniclasticum aestuarii]MBO1264055.1 diacylglycerol kinase family lipid kinase [Proteiniclasticum aestuarii]
MKKAQVIINPSSGRGKAEDYADPIIKILEKRYEEVEIRKTEGAGDAKRFADEGTRDGANLIVAVGGDGTVNEAVNGIASHEKRPKFAIIPLGTVNDLARVLGIPLDPEEAIEILSEEHLVTIDLAKASDTYFTNGLAVGKIPESIHEVTAEEKSKLGPLAYIWAGAKKLLENEKIAVKVLSEEREFEGELTAVVMSLTGQLGGIKEVFPEAKLQDGKIHILLVHEMDLAETAKILPEILSRQITESENMTYITTEKVTLEALHGEDYVSDVDGEEGPHLPFTVEVLKAHLQVLVP